MPAAELPPAAGTGAGGAAGSQAGVLILPDSARTAPEAAAGTPHAVFPESPAMLQQPTKAPLVCVT